MDSFQSAKEEIKRIVEIVELIGQFVELKKGGLNHIGLCPFHSEKAPSFTVNAAKQMFHCFGCKKGGDVFAFWMEYHKVSFPQALRDLAEKYHVSLPEKKISATERRRLSLKETVFHLNETAGDYFHGILTQSQKGSPGVTYFTQRSISSEIISGWKLGYAADEWDGLTRFLKKKKCDLEKAASAGLIIPKKNGGYYDRFRGRVIFPIFNLRRQIAGFGGRILDNSLPKYLNTPETPVFNKGALLYGLHTSYRAINESERVVIVEGYTDVLSLNSYGFSEAVATLGTAITQNHIRMLKGYAKRAIVVFDSDAAGRAAALKSLPLFLSEGFASRIMILPEGHDPDSFVREKGLEHFLKRLDKSVPMFDYYIDLKLTQEGDQIENQVDALKEIMPILSELGNGAQRSFYIRRLSERMGISETALVSELTNWEKYRSRYGKNAEFQAKSAPSINKNIDDVYFLNLLIHHPGMMERLVHNDFGLLLSDPTALEIFNEMSLILEKEGKVTHESILQKLEGASLVQFREAMLTAPIFTDERAEEAVSGFEERVQKIKMANSIEEARGEGNLEKLNELLKLRQEENEAKMSGGT